VQSAAARVLGSAGRARVERVAQERPVIAIDVLAS